VTEYGGLPFASIANDFLRLDYLTTTGPRIVGLYVSGVEGNFLASTPDVHWETPHGEYYLRGGHRLWTAPEDSFYTCPEDDMDVLLDEEQVVLKSPVDGSGLQKEIAICLDRNCVHLTHRVTWHGEDPIELAPWAITQLRMAILPLASGLNGLAPNRNLVLWPYSSIHDERLELYDDLILVHGDAKEQALKIGNKNGHGWIAYAKEKVLFIKKFSTSVNTNFPDMETNAQVYVKDVCLELESLGPLCVLRNKESIMHEEIWQIVLGKYPSGVGSARNIIGRLSQSITNGDL